MKPLDLVDTPDRRSEELLKFFRMNAVQHPGTAAQQRVLPLSAFEEYAGISTSEHPLFFRPEIFSSGSDWNSYWVQGVEVLRYLTIDGLFKAVTVLAVANFVERGRIHGQNQLA